MARIRELGYAVERIVTFDIGTSDTLVDLEGETGFLHNTSTGKMYYGLQQNAADSDRWEIAAEDVHGPLALGKVYFKGQVAGKLKVMFLRGV